VHPADRELLPRTAKRNFDKIYTGLDIEEEELPIIFKHISTLQLKPINESHESGLVKETIIPDFILTVEGRDRNGGPVQAKIAEPLYQ
jgi:DNA-directed RNA polymerase specialized sigma54-like protein